MDTLHEEAIANENEFRTKDVQPNQVGDPNEFQPTSKEVVVTQLILVNVITNEQVDVLNQYNSVGMLVEYGTLGLVGEAKIELTQMSDVEYGFISVFGFYSEKAKLEYFSKHEDSMET